MKDLIDIYKRTGLLHHAYILEGDTSVVENELLPFFENHIGHSVHGNPDFTRLSIKSFGIDDSRLLKDLQLKKAVSKNGRKIFVVTIDTITQEAQHSLLKVLEEPTDGTHFFFVLPFAGVLLPTVLSRVFLISKTGQYTGGGSYKRFLSASPTQRLSMLEDILKDKDKMIAIDFLEHLEVELYNLWKKKKESNVAFAMKEIATVRSYLFDRSSSVKMLMEHVALALPIC